MTGVAASLCDDLPAEEKAAIEREMPGVKWGRRIAILNDLSPAATFIAHNYNAEVDPEAFLEEAKALLNVWSENAAGFIELRIAKKNHPSLEAERSVRSNELLRMVGSDELSTVRQGNRLFRSRCRHVC